MLTEGYRKGILEKEKQIKMHILQPTLNHMN